ncbi:hypothetical protein A6M13_10950 [Caryophanon tenue]|uniref:DUF4825 domain-containing protein n=1 Tax=Caryophanon tenue TaxID=33978 RepID=A0A1C0YKW4_9BACL|nr:hypothetical protein A6M13_10950 [Caryophanon tenue]
MLILLLVACSDEQQQGVFLYKNAYIGDASAVSAIVEQLENSEQFMQMELFTTAKPYAVNLQYAHISEQQAMRNATYIFTLVQNVDVVQFTFADEQYELTRQEIESVYGLDVRNIHDEQKLQALIEEKL